MESFRSEVKLWLQEKCPLGVRGPAREEDTVWGGATPFGQVKTLGLWLQAWEKGWTCPTWPKNTAVAA